VDYPEEKLGETFGSPQHATPFVIIIYGTCTPHARTRTRGGHTRGSSQDEGWINNGVATVDEFSFRGSNKPNYGVGLRKVFGTERRHRSNENKLTEESLRIDVSLLDWSKAFAVGRKIPSRNFVRFEKKMSNTNQRLSFNPVSSKS